MVAGLVFGRGGRIGECSPGCCCAEVDAMSPSQFERWEARQSQIMLLSVWLDWLVSRGYLASIADVPDDSAESFLSCLDGEV